MPAAVPGDEEEKFLLERRRGFLRRGGGSTPPAGPWRQVAVRAGEVVLGAGVQGQAWGSVIRERLIMVNIRRNEGFL